LADEERRHLMKRIREQKKNYNKRLMGGDYRGDGGDDTGGRVPPQQFRLGDANASVPPRIANFSKQKLDIFSILTTILVYCIFPYTIPQNIYSISFPRRIRGICNTCIRRGSGASGYSAKLTSSSTFRSRRERAEPHNLGINFPVIRHFSSSLQNAHSSEELNGLL